METVIEIIQKCQNKCIHCSSMSSPEGKRIMSVGDVINLMKGDVCISGGEPLLHPDIIEIVNNRPVKVYTSGVIRFPYWNLRKDTILIFSVHSDRPRDHDYVTQRNGSWFECVKSINLCLSIGFRVEAHVVPMSVNIERLNIIYNWLIAMGVHRVSMLKFVPQGRGALFESMPVDVEIFNGPRWGRPWRGGCGGKSNKSVYRYDGKVLNCESEKWT